MQDSPREACGVFGVFAPGEDVARLTFYGLYALQHRGQESAGIATSDGRRLYFRTGMGLVAQVFDEESLESLPGKLAIGHTRYSTTGSSKIANAQPIHVMGRHGEIALAHNGNVVNAEIVRQGMEEEGYQFVTSSDSEVIAQMLASAPGDTWQEHWRHCMKRLEGAYSLAVLTPDSLMAARDPMGVRPLCLGRLGPGWVVASESCALDHLGADFIRELEPGEVVRISDAGVETFQAGEPRKRSFCVFENIYFARPDSVMMGKLLYPQRMAMGAELAREYPVDADVVIGVPDSATAAAVGYANESAIPFREGLVKNRYVGRTFIQPDQRIRELGVNLKFNPLPEILAGKRVVVVDDSIVRGTTTPRIVQMLRRAGAREVHVRICAPPIVSPCYFGVDMATRWELIAGQNSDSDGVVDVDAIAAHIGADSLGYLSMDGLMKAVETPEDNFCNACFTGRYPVSVPLQMDKLAFEKAGDSGRRGEPLPVISALDSAFIRTDAS
ncbi:MAG: amidophosphoribosyltransferase [Dehalococcoidia bacterium]|nr:amidophosphoribosyltransferase [Dehalococcoidia bacterium]